MIIKKKNFKRFQKDLKALGKTIIQIGATGSRPDTELSNADLLIIHEFGATIKKRNNIKLKKPIQIPARMPIRKTFTDSSNLSLIRQGIQELIKENYVAKTGRLKNKNIVDGIGRTLMLLVQATIRRRVGPANTKSTLRSKTGTVPLIDTGRLVNTITFGVKR